MEIICLTEKELSSPHDYNHTRDFTVKSLLWGKKPTNPKYKICPPTPEHTLTKTEQCQSCTWSIKI